MFIDDTHARYTDLYPFEDKRPEGLATYIHVVTKHNSEHVGEVHYHGRAWTREQWQQLNAAFEKAFEIADAARAEGGTQNAE